MGIGVMLLYQQVAVGGLKAFDGSHKIHSRKLYRSREDAEAEMGLFLEKVTTPINDMDMTYLDSEQPIKTHVVELELED